MPSRTFCLIKPEAVARDLLGDILDRLAKVGLRPVKLVMCQPDKYRVEDHYLAHAGKPYYDDLVAGLTAGQVVYAVLESEGRDAVLDLRAEMGPFDPRVPGTIRGDLMRPEDPRHLNLIHGSDSDEEARREARIWFGPGGLDGGGRLHD